MSVLSVLANKPYLIDRLFVNKEYNKEGVYRLRICNNGEWQEITIDDLFPCQPFGDPLFASSVRNELWVMLLEKAYAKLHGSYYSLKQGKIGDVLRDLTGLPTTTISFDDSHVQDFINNGQFWDLLQYYVNQDYLVCLSNQNPVISPTTFGEAQVPKNEAFTILQMLDLGR